MEEKGVGWQDGSGPARERTASQVWFSELLVRTPNPGLAQCSMPLGCLPTPTSPAMPGALRRQHLRRKAPEVPGGDRPNGAGGTQRRALAKQASKHTYFVQLLVSRSQGAPHRRDVHFRGNHQHCQLQDSLLSPSTSMLSTRLLNLFRFGGREKPPSLQRSESSTEPVFCLPPI